MRQTTEYPRTTSLRDIEDAIRQNNERIQQFESIITQAQIKLRIAHEHSETLKHEHTRMLFQIKDQRSIDA